jgi:hypothetical protein
MANPDRAQDKVAANKPRLISSVWGNGKSEHGQNPAGMDTTLKFVVETTVVLYLNIYPSEIESAAG